MPFPWPFSRKKKSKQKPRQEPDNTEFADYGSVYARVYRQAPKMYRGEQVGGLQSGNWAELDSCSDLEDRVKEMCGGGSYYADLCMKGTTNPFARHAWELSGRPLMNGQPIGGDELQEAPKKKKTDEDTPPEIRELEKEIEISKRQGELLKVRKSSGLPSGDESSNEQVEMLQSELEEMKTSTDEKFNALLAALNDKESKEEERERREREREERKEERERQERLHREQLEMQREQAKTTQEILVAALSGKKDDGGLSAMMKVADSQMQAMKMSIEQSNQNVERITKQIESTRQSQEAQMAKTVELMMARAQEQAQHMFDYMKVVAENKSTTVEAQMENMRNAIRLGLDIAQGRAPDGEDEATSWPAFAERVSSKVLDAVNGFVAARGASGEAPSKEQIAEMIKDAAHQVQAEGVKPPAALPVPGKDATPPTAPLAKAPNPAARPAQAKKARPGDISPNDRDPHAGMDRVLSKLIEAANYPQKGVDPWVAVRPVAMSHLPPGVIQEILKNQSNWPGLQSVMRKYASPAIAEEAIKVAQRMVDKENAAKPPSSPAQPTSPARPAAAPVKPPSPPAKSPSPPAQPATAAKPPAKPKAKAKRKTRERRKTPPTSAAEAARQAAESVNGDE